MANLFDDICEKLDAEQIEDKDELINALIATLDAVQSRVDQASTITDAEFHAEVDTCLKDYKSEPLTCNQQTLVASLEEPAEYCENLAVAGSQYCKTHQD